MAVEVPDCNDNEQTVDETDIDCGGRTCAPCPDEKRCVTGTDCESAICTNQVCQPPTCTDLAVNGDETDLNCGGSCPKCAEGAHCEVNADCTTGNCGDAICFSPTCSDEVLQDGCPLLVDNTPYSLSPSHAPTKCIDDAQQSVAEGNGMLLWGCKVEIHQTFWAVAKADGYFALRSALSGKCLQVRGASMDENAVVEQAACTYSSQQLWKPARVDATYMTLRSKLSNLVLDVAGSNVANDGQSIVQGKASSSADTYWRLQKRSNAAYIALSPSDDDASRISHAGALTTLSGDDSPSSHWQVVPGLNDPTCVSFQSSDEPGRYLRHAAFRVWSDKNDGTSTFKKDATFRYVNPFVGWSPLLRGLESTNYPGYFLLRSEDIITLTQLQDSDDYKANATWRINAR